MTPLSPPGLHFAVGQVTGVSFGSKDMFLDSRNVGMQSHSGFFLKRGRKSRIGSEQDAVNS